MKLKLIIIFLVTIQSNAQHITICKAYTEFGVPLDIIYSKNVDVNQTVCILLDAGNRNISGSNLILTIEKKTDETREKQFRKTYRVDPDKNWFAASFKFSKEGIYEIYFSDSKQNKLAFTSLSVGNYQIKTEIPAPNVKYQNPEITFCEDVRSNLPVNIKKQIPLKLNDGSIYIYLNDSQPLNTKQIRVNIMCKPQKNSDYTELISDKKYSVDRSWSNAYFKYKFEKAGDYKISIFDEREILIKTTYITAVN